MKGFKRENQLLSLCGLNCGLCPMFSGNTVADAEREINPAPLPNAVWNTGKLNTAMNVNNIPAKNT